MYIKTGKQTKRTNTNERVNGEITETISDSSDEVLNVLNDIKSHLIETQLEENKVNKWKVFSTVMDKIFLIIAVIY